MTTTTEDKHRLPTSLIPSHYELTVFTDLKALKFYGSVVVHLNVKETTSLLAFNSDEGLELHDLSISSTSFAEPQTYSSNALEFDKASQRINVKLSETLQAGTKVTVKVAFERELGTSMMGYYRSSWQREGKTEYYALTQFEATSAREAFPCWDEPALKATFALTMISRADTINLNNMPSTLEDTYSEAGVATSNLPWFAEKLASVIASNAKQWKITKFETTPIMSPYIVAWANGDFEYLESSYTSPLNGKVRPLRIYATADNIGQARFALEVKEKVVPLFEKLFDIEYPLPKLDTLVAHDFDAGAMENWGLITGRTMIFLLDPNNESISVKKTVAGVMSHEIAHMWFGNITTMKWWDNLYLNEGFATLMGEIVSIDKLYPEWKPHSGFVSGHLSRALTADANASSHPIEVACPDANMVNQIFDGLSYSKAASILRMLYEYVGAEKFLHGVSIYLKNNLYGNTITEDLWSGIQTATGVDVPQMMDNWVKKIGYPVVTVTKKEGGIHVRQDRFLDSGAVDPKDNETIWTIPLSLLTVSDDGKVSIDRQIVLDEQEKFIPLKTMGVFKLNAGTTGVFRVLYDSESLAAIAKEATKSDSILSLEDRMGLILDALALAKAGLMKTSDVFTLLDAFRNEKESLVWSAIADTVGELSSIWGENAEIKGLIDAFSRGLFVPLVKRLGYEPVAGESIDDRELRVRAITRAALAGDPDVVKLLIERFNEFIATGKVDSDTEIITMKIAVRHGGRAEFDAVKNIAAKPARPSLSTAAILAMCATRDEAMVQDIFDTCIPEARDQNIMFYFVGLRGNSKYRVFAMKELQKKWDYFAERLGAGSLMRIVALAYSSLSTREIYDQTVEFFKDKDTSKYDMSLKQALDSILTRTAWIERSTDDVMKWLKANAATKA